MCLRFSAAAVTPFFPFLAVHMYRSPAVRPQQSPGTPRPQGRFPSPGACWGYSARQTPYRVPGHHRGGSPRGGYNPAYSSGSPAYSPGFSPGYSPGPNRGFSPGSNQGYSPGYRSFSPGSFRGSPRGNGQQNWRRGGGFHRRGYGSGHTSQVRRMKCFVFSLKNVVYFSIHVNVCTCASFLCFLLLMYILTHTHTVSPMIAS